MQIEQPRAQGRARATARATATERISASSAAQARHDEADDYASAGGAVRDHAAVVQKPLELVLAPAAAERGRMQRRERRGVARTRLDERRLGAAEQPGEQASHRRGSRRRPAAARRARADRAASAAHRSSCAAAPSRATQSMSGARVLLDARWRRSARPMRRDQHRAPEPMTTRSARPAGAHRFAHAVRCAARPACGRGRTPGNRHDRCRASIAATIVIAVSRGDMRRGERGERRESDRRLVRRQARCRARRKCRPAVR